MTTYSHQYEPITDPDELELVRSAFAATGRVPTGYAYSPRWSPPFRKIVGGGGTPPPAHLTPVEQWLADRIKALEAGGGGGATPGGSMLMLTLTSGETAMLVMPFTGTFTGWSLVGDDTGDAELDIRISGFGTLPSPATSISGETPPKLVGQQMARSVTLTDDWQPEFSAGDIIQVVAGTFTGVSELTVALHIARDGASGDIPISDPYRDMILEESGLVAYWPLADKQGAIFEDVFGSMHGTVANPEQATWGQPSLLPIGGGTCVALAEASGDAPILAVPHHASLSFANETITVECWIQNIGGPGQYRTLIGKGKNDSSPRDFRINVTSSAREIRGTVYTESGSVHVETGVTIADDALHHCVLTKNGNEVYFDLDGVRYGPGTITGDVNTNTEPLTFGSWSDGSGYWRGYLQHVAVYDRFFTVEDSQAHYQAGMGT